MNVVENGQVCESAASALRHGETRLAAVPGLIEKIIDLRAWEERETRPGKVVRLKSLIELITLPFDEGWGEDPKKIEAVIKSEPRVLTKWREAMKGKPGRPQLGEDKSGNNVTELEQERITGNAKAYTLSRLEKDHPELFERVCAGEMSANAAAIEAGFRKKPTHEERAVAAFRKAENRLQVVKAIVGELEPHERSVVAEWLTEA